MTLARACAAIAAAALTTACGGDDGGLPSLSSNSTDGSGGDAAEGGSGGGDDVGGSGGSGEVDSVLAPLEIVDEADTDCAPIGLPGTQILTPAQATVPFDRLVRVGTKRAGGGTPGGAFTFDPDGGNQSQVFGAGAEYNIMASEGDRLGILAQSDATIVYGRFDAKGKQDGDVLDVSEDQPANLAVGGGDGEALAVWGIPGRMRARGIVHGQLAGEAFDFGVGTIDNYFTASVTRQSDGFAIAWSGNATPDEFRTMFMTTTVDGEHSEQKELTRSSTVHRVAKLARTPSGYALLIDIDSAPRAPVVVILDPTGTVVGKAHRFLGVSHGWDLAVHEGDLGLVARRATGEIAFRALDGQGAPIAPWRCVTTPSDDLYQSAGIDDDEEGFAILHRTPDGAEALSLVDRTGSALEM
jgi:hypothetical protein